MGKSDREFLGSVASGEGGFSECRLKYANGKWVLLVPYTPAAVQAEGTDPQGVAALDRGARVFTTVYDGDRVVAVEHDRKLMAKLQARLDKLRSLRARKAISSRSYLRGRRRTKRRWDNLMRDLHYKLASELVKYKAVGLPSFETENMVQGGLARSTKRELLGLQHGKFKQRLIHKARGRTHVLPTDERCVVVQIHSRMFVFAAQALFSSGHSANLPITLVPKRSFSTKTCTQCGTIRNMVWGRAWCA